MYEMCIRRCVPFSYLYLPFDLTLKEEEEEETHTSAKESGKAKSSAWKSEWIVLLLLSYHRLPKVHFGWELT